MALNPTLSRRRLLQAGAGAMAASAVAAGLPVMAFAAPAPGKGGRLIPAGKVGTITYTQRDVPGRIGIAAAAANPALSVTMGYLGGANFPEDPTDLGPLVPLPGGWRELFAYLANAGFTQIEFAGYGQNLEQPGRRRTQPGAGRRDHARSRGRHTSPTGAPCAASSTSSASRPSATTASSRTRGRAPAAPAA